MDLALTGRTITALRINGTAPDFTAETTEGPVSFHDRIGEGYAILVSHPELAPISTGQSGIALEAWGNAVDYPLIGVPELKVAQLYHMLPASELDSSQG
ncbi:MAG: hypothetical protein ACE5FS_02575 [Paracoccaceae bacterium]